MQWYWLIHHDLLLDQLSEPVENRIAYIRAHKPAHEVETRLRWMRPVQHPERIPLAVVDAWNTHVDAQQAHDDAWKANVEGWKARVDEQKALDGWKAYDETWKAHKEAWKAYHDARKASTAEIAALHAEECPGCPWDGKQLIFPKPEVTA